jgi:nucleoid-associated protein YgaU
MKCKLARTTLMALVAFGLAACQNQQKTEEGAEPDAQTESNQDVQTARQQGTEPGLTPLESELVLPEQEQAPGSAGAGPERAETSAGAETEGETLTLGKQQSETNGARDDRPDTYTVQKGDTLWSIAERFYNSGKRWRDIADANGIDDPSKIATGTTLELP